MQKRFVRDKSMFTTFLSRFYAPHYLNIVLDTEVWHFCSCKVHNTNAFFMEYRNLPIIFISKNFHTVMNYLTSAIALAIFS
jgi:hypothetical protein